MSPVPTDAGGAGVLIGYARVSTEDQKLDLQRDALISAGVDDCHLHQDHASALKKTGEASPPTGPPSAIDVL